MLQMAEKNEARKCYESEETSSSVSINISIQQIEENHAVGSSSVAPAVFPVFGDVQIPIPTNYSFSNADITQVDRSSSQDCQWPDMESSSSRPLPIFLKFEDVHYSVKLKKHAGGGWKNGKKREREKEKIILNGVTGSVGPGQIVALMGPSGSGKTTLLKIVGGRIRAQIKGSVTYNDIPYNTCLKRRIGFVTQDDVLFPQLTVQETLTFAALLKLPSTMSKQQKILRAETVLTDLGLDRCRHTKIGGTFVRGISGGERKRTSIGYEILVDPSLLLLDEPTSGLDSTTATKLLQLLQNIAHSGITVMTTIHQPSSRMFHMFDKLLLISEGHGIYSGRAKEAMPYFSSLGFVPQLAMNPADFLLDIATGQVTDIMLPQHFHSHCPPQDTQREVVKYLQRKYKTELEAQEKEALQRQGRAPEHLQNGVLVRKDWNSTCLEQLCVLAKRTFRQRHRDYLDHLRIVQAVGVALLLGLLWWKSSTDTETHLRDQVGLMFYICIFWTSSSLFGAVYVFPFEQSYLRKERTANMYRLSIYYLCSTTCDMIAGVLYPIVFMAILYFMAGFRRTASAFLLTLLATLLIVLTGQGAGEFIGAAILSIKRAGAAASLLLLLFLLTGGYYVQHIPVFIRWLKYVSFMYYGFRLLLKVQYSGDEMYECEGNGLSNCKSLQSSPTFATVDLNGGLLETWILVLMAFAYRLLAYLCLRSRIVVLP